MPQGTSPLPYNLYISDQLLHPNTQVAEYADDKVVYFTNTELTSTSVTS